ncbi:ribokinase [Halopolyspora algeriensis]|uniref:Ribokinase n=1 Tax=Halopolyspora algeriensis TaxID=1500506 RepID=A0A368VSI0_9ACTN|nr:ribokinase [Halopolyspora algeriensis]TQM56595.1 ribokinase [Halopolyspora algeriensis]
MTVFGSCNMDLVAYVATPPQRGETVHGREFRTVSGGKGANQAIAAARAGAHTAMVGAVGADEFGARIRETLQRCAVDTRGLREVPGHSGTAHIVVDDAGGNSIIVIPAANGTVTAPAEGDEERIAASQSLLLQLEIPLDGVTAAAETARRHGVPVVLTPAPAVELPASVLDRVDVLVPNEHEAAVLTGHHDPEQAMRDLLKRVPEVVITMGDRGSFYGNRAGDRIDMPAYPARAVDTTAAGDTFVGVLSVAVATGVQRREALRRASAASALSVQRNGASSSMPTAREVDEFLAAATGDR